MVERFNGRIGEVLATTRFDSQEQLAETLKRYVYLYNHHIPQQALGHHPPIRHPGFTGVAIEASRFIQSQSY